MERPEDAQGAPGQADAGRRATTRLATGRLATGRLTPAWIAFLVLALAVVLGLTSLGIWQLQRMGWKQGLIAAVGERIHLAPVPAPPPQDWAEVAARPDDFIYRRVTLRGHWLPAQDSFVQATTDQGAGYWLLTPLQRDDGAIVLINRGFVSRREAPPPGDDASGAAAARTPDVTVIGLLRQSEPEGRFPRRNDPAADRWYNRSVEQIAERRGLGGVAPYFVDAQQIDGNGAVAPGAEPITGLTVIEFRDHHLGYALTWFTLALMTVAAVLRVLRWHWHGRPAADPTADPTVGQANGPGRG